MASRSTKALPAQMGLAPARTLRDVTRNCDEDAPLRTADPRWEDLSAARGDRATEVLRRELEYRPAGRFVHASFVSHRGAGKSTEILRTTESLAAAYESVYIEATVEMDPFEIDGEDLLVNLAMAVESRMRQLGKPLPRELLQRVTRWFDEVVSTTKWAQNFNVEAAAGVEAKASIPFVGSLFGSLKGLFKRESEYRTEVSLALRPKSAQLESIYSCHYLYTVRLRRPDQPYNQFDGPGRDLLEKALARRLDLSAVMPDKAARDRLIAASGGAIRELMELVSQAALLAGGSTIELGDVEQALGRRRQRLRDLIDANGWLETLVKLARLKQIFSDEKCMSVLFHRLAFKYNGDGWYDVHPLVAEIPELKHASSSLV